MKDKQEIKTFKDLHCLDLDSSYFTSTSGGTWHTMSEEQREAVFAVLKELRLYALNAKSRIYNGRFRFKERKIIDYDVILFIDKFFGFKHGNPTKSLLLLNKK